MTTSQFDMMSIFKDFLYAQHIRWWLGEKWSFSFFIACFEFFGTRVVHYIKRKQASLKVHFFILKFGTFWVFLTCLNSKILRCHNIQHFQLSQCLLLRIIHHHGWWYTFMLKNHGWGFKSFTFGVQWMQITL